MTQTCSRCGGTQLAPTVTGARRGTCHCPQRGYIVGRRSYRPQQPIIWNFRIVWEGDLLATEYPTRAAAEAALAILEQEVQS